MLMKSLIKLYYFYTYIGKHENIYTPVWENVCGEIVWVGKATAMLGIWGGRSGGLGGAHLKFETKKS